MANRVHEGGHTVPIDKIIDRYYRSLNFSLDAALLSDRAYFYDNTPDGQPPLLEFKLKDQEIAKIYSETPHEWILDLIKDLTTTYYGDLPSMPPTI